MPSTCLLRAMLVSIALSVAACASAPPPTPPPLTTATPEAMVATIRAAAGNDPEELAVQPLRDPMVEDLRQEAARLETQRHYVEAAAALDKALAISGDDPALLQERAETAVLLRDFDQAEAFARRAWALGAKVGPLCRRHWATVQQARLVAADAAGADVAASQLDACKVDGPNRF